MNFPQKSIILMFLNAAVLFLVVAAFTQFLCRQEGVLYATANCPVLYATAKTENR